MTNGWSWPGDEATTRAVRAEFTLLDDGLAILEDGHAEEECTVVGFETVAAVESFEGSAPEMTQLIITSGDGSRLQVELPTAIAEEVLARRVGHGPGTSVVSVPDALPQVDAPVIASTALAASAVLVPDHVDQAVTAAAARPRPPAPVAEPTTHRIGRRTRIGLVAAGVLAGLAIGVAVYELYERGSRWEDRAVAAEAKAADLGIRLDVTRSTLATTEANLANTRKDLDGAKASLVDAQTKVTDQDRRLTELSNEKAQVQDQRNLASNAVALGKQAATDMLACRSDMAAASVEILNQVGTSYPSFDYVNVLTSRMSSSCATADSSVDAFIAAS